MAAHEAPYQSGRLCSSSGQKINAIEHKPRPSSPSPTELTSISFQGESAHFPLSQQPRRLKLPREELLIWPRSCSAAWLHPAGIRNFSPR